MANELDFHYLRVCKFFETGQYSFSLDNDGKLHVQKREVSLFDAHCYPSPHSIRALHEKKYQTSEAYLGASLSRALDSTVKETVRTAIIDQWAETYDIVNRLNVEPNSVHFAIQPPGAEWNKHNHSIDCKQTLTFCYTFNEYAIEGQGESKFVVENEIEYDFIFPKDKFYFTFRNNLLHKSISNEWRFFWIFDFDRYIDIPASDFVEMPIKFE